MYCDGVVYPSLDKSKCLQLLRQHVFEHVLHIRGAPFLQGTGIPQGSIVSTALCNYYFGHLETQGPLTKFLDGTKRESGAHCLLMRLTDDFLFITSDEGLAREFVHVIHVGFPEYNCRVNALKSLVNFDVVAPGVGGVPVTVRKTGTGFIPWCGLLFKTGTCEVFANYSRYCHPHHVGDAVTVPASSGRGYSDLLHLYKSYFRPKCHPVMLDGSVNGMRAVVLNLCRIACLAAAKLVCLITKPQFSAIVTSEVLLRCVYPRSNVVAFRGLDVHVCVVLSQTDL